MSVSFNRSVYEDRLAAAVTLQGRFACTASDTPEKVPALSVRLDPQPYVNAQGEERPQATAELEGYEGLAVTDAQISADERTISATISRPAFARRDWRCVRGNSNEADSDFFAFSFAGFEPKELTLATARPALEEELSRVYGDRWASGGSWTACPREEFFPEGLSSESEGPQALCEFRFAVGSGRWRHGSVLLTETAGAITVSNFTSSTFFKATRRCRPLKGLRSYGVVDRRLRAGGWVGCSDSSASLIRDLHGMKPGVRRVGFHGTNRAGFEDAVTFRCVLRARAGRRRSASCANKLGDRFLYTFRLARR